LRHAGKPVDDATGALRISAPAQICSTARLAITPRGYLEPVHFAAGKRYVGVGE
jgi:hypothetical protein